MLCRDDAERLPRVLDSVAGLVEEIVVVDSGSTDGSQDLAREYGATVYEHEMVDEASQRSFLLDKARGRGDWLLTLDSDEELERSAEPLELDPAVPVYRLRVRQGEVTYRMPKLLRADRAWQVHGRTHAALTYDYSTGRNLETLAVIHHHDRPDQAWKYPEVQSILEETLRDDPSNTRAIFYLAQTFRDQGNLDRAVPLYKLRATMGGHEEEAWYAQFQAAFLSCDFDALLAAHRRRPSRYEPLYALAQLASALADETTPSEDEALLVHDRDAVYIRANV